MGHFLYRLLPPRPTFPMDMTDTERTNMVEHFGYWGRLIAERKVVAYGPVMDPKGTYAIAVLEVEDEASAYRIGESDPAITSRAGLGTELHQMPDAIVRP